MKDNIRYSADVERMLREAGWFPGRVIDATQAIRGLRELGGYSITDSIQSFYQEFGNIEVTDKRGRSLFSTIFSKLDWWEYEVKPIAAYLEWELCPVANASLSVLLMALDGKVYHTDTTSFFELLGETGIEAVENILSRKFGKRILDDGTLKYAHDIFYKK